MIIKELEYSVARERITSGDLLAWSKSPPDSIFSNIILSIIKWLTSSKFGHVGIAWKNSHRLLVVEATIPMVKVVPVSKREQFYWIPVNTKWTSMHNNKLLGYLGCPYSVLDCIRAYLGKKHIDDDRWQCAELCNDFYETVGIPLEVDDIPISVLDAAYKLNGGIIYLVNPSIT